MSHVILYHSCIQGAKDLDEKSKSGDFRIDYFGNFDDNPVPVLDEIKVIVYSGTGVVVSTWSSTHSWIVSTPHSVPVYTSCTLTNFDRKYCTSDSKY